MITVEELLTYTEADERGCMIWQGTLTHKGYARLSRHPYGERLARAILSYTHDMTDKIACHTCDNPSCINPEHLYAGTYSDNNKDARIRGRNVGNKGARWSEEARKSLSETRKRMYANGHPHPRSGATFSEESREKMRKSRLRYVEQQKAEAGK